MEQSLHKSERYYLFTGIFFIFFGLAALFAPGMTAISLTVIAGYIFAFFTVAGGTVGLLSSIDPDTHKRVLKFEFSLLNIVAGFIIIFVTIMRPDIIATFIVYFIAFCAIFIGILEITASFELRKLIKNEWLHIINGFFSIIFGLLILVDAFAGAIALIILLGVFALIYGGIYLSLFFKIKKLNNIHEQN